MSARNTARSAEGRVGMGRLRATNKAFTIIELLIVIAVIAILAAIVIVSYGQITKNARIATLRSDLTQAAGDLQQQKSETGAYPTSQIAADAMLKASEGVTYQYSYNATTLKYCLTGTLNDTSYWIDPSRTESEAGGCAGHGQNGLAAITNIVKNPKGSGSAAQYAATGWFTSICSTNVTDTAGVSWSSTTWHRIAWNGTSCNTARLNLDLADLENGETYRVLALVGNNGASPVTFTMDLADAGLTSQTLAAGAQMSFTFTATRATFDSTYRFVDLNVLTSGSTGLLVSGVMVTKGTGTYNYGDGSSSNWVWNGTANASTSTGPQL